MRVSGSKLRLLDSCGWWASPDVHPPQGESTTYSRKGTALHALIEGRDTADALAGLKDAEIDDVADWHAAWERSEWARVPWLHEVKFAWHVASDTARVLAAPGSRDYSDVQDDEVPATADLVFVDAAAGVVYVPDIKTGFQEHAEPIESHAQLRFLALCAARAFMVDRARIQILKLDAVQLRPSEADIGPEGLDAIAAENRIRLARRGGAPQSGSHCTDLYCPAITICPRAQQTVALALPKDTPAEWASTAPTTPAHCLWKRDGAEFLEELAKQWRAESRAFADANNGVVLPDDSARIWHRRDQTRETIDIDGLNGGRAEEVLDRAGLGAAIEIKRNASKESIRRVLAGRGLKGKALEAELENVLVPIRVAGATRNATIPKYIEEKIK